MDAAPETCGRLVWWFIVALGLVNIGRDLFSGAVASGADFASFYDVARAMRAGAPRTSCIRSDPAST